MSSRRPIKIAITAMGGQGGGVLADWIVALAEAHGFIAQSTSVPGVAQRTGSTVYYIEIFAQDLSKQGRAPVLALMPVPGDVDIVIASELMEAGRALSRGFVTRKTTLIASLHRVYAIGEKIKLGDGRITADGVVDAAKGIAGRFIAFDMEAAAAEAGSVISSVLFGALAGAGALPFDREVFEKTIREGRSAEANLKGFAIGFEAAQCIEGLEPKPHSWPAVPQASRAAQKLLNEVRDDFPGHSHAILKEGLKRMVDYQGRGQAKRYLNLMREVSAADEAAGGERRGYRLTREVARYLALAMSYEDAFRVADLKTRSSRFARVREDIKAEPGQLVTVREYLHPRAEEIADVMPAPLGALVLKTKWLRSVVSLLAGKGRRVSTTRLRGFLQLWLLASLKWTRPFSYRAEVENARIDAWLALIRDTAKDDYDLACEIAGLQRLIKGYGETHERGLANAEAIIGALDAVKTTGKPAALLHELRDAALADDEGAALTLRLGKVRAAFPSLEKGGLSAPASPSRPDLAEREGSSLALQENPP